MYKEYQDTKTSDLCNNDEVYIIWVFSHMEFVEMDYSIRSIFIHGKSGLYLQC